MLYEVRVAANKGLGLFAKNTIPRGTRILAEKPLIALRLGQRPTDVLGYAKRLDLEEKKRLLGLSWHPGNGVKRMGRWVEALCWAVRNRATDGKSARAQGNDTGKISATVTERLSELVESLGEAVQILSIFRSNSFNLAASEILSSGVQPSSTSSPKTSNPPNALKKVIGNNNLRVEEISPPSRPAIELALFPSIARINHSCNPNAQANYHPLHQTFNVHATRDIPAGEEVSINYLPEHGQLRAQRVAKLEDGYGFTCNCPVCDLDTKAGQKGEQSRREMQQTMKRTRALFTDSTGVAESRDAGYGADGMPESLSSTVSDKEQRQIDALRAMPEEDRQTWLRERELKVLNKMLAMYQTQGIVGREVSSMHYAIARLQRSTGSDEQAMASAEAGLELEKACLGVDHPAYLEALAMVEGLRVDAARAQLVSTKSK
ncbi:SET domain-containing protein [Paraphaeosphaeria sporulosa]|uniref:SET domain-containing protein n=1 Tax=Paraphaeosphaeria sporulosa TaxID=1460663 RepID=A0A177CJZ1_9PLEO|nr:SET domain-containing protein [Paraphaeosphaeria sporulosa]OAG07188.1 SET domain-containing protein [Paraphaeosphaeria sporulosa]